MVVMTYREANPPIKEFIITITRAEAVQLLLAQKDSGLTFPNLTFYQLCETLRQHLKEV